ncbi:hypothetical protein M9434_004862 [Picochlorum sp. BPE23]|nr:hypothetical protein M9434_004862 [Picochlorum sp. BPE23]
MHSLHPICCRINSLDHQLQVELLERWFAFQFSEMHSKACTMLRSVMMKHGYIGEFEFVDNHRSGKIVVELNGRLNKCGVISPRYDISAGDVEDWVGRLLPSRQFGFFVMTTSQGIMDHEEARRKKLGGKVLGFFY